MTELLGILEEEYYKYDDNNFDERGVHLCLKEVDWFGDGWDGEEENCEMKETFYDHVCVEKHQVTQNCNTILSI